MKNKHLIISRRLSRNNAIVRGFFMGWGLVFVMILAAAPFIYKNLLWANLDIINPGNVHFDQFRITNGDFAGLDSRNNPFRLHAAKIWQTFENPDTIMMESVRANVVQEKDGKPVHMDIKSNAGEYSKSTGILVLIDDVSVDSEDGDKVRTKKMTIQLRN
jgi:hypothetical protein